MLIKISLSGANSKSEVLEVIGESLDFGGQEENLPSDANADIGWGVNWDALVDCLRMLSSGGIWGTSRRFEFPLIIQFIDYQDFMESSPDDFQTLVSILESTRDHYLESNMEFNFKFG